MYALLPRRWCGSGGRVLSACSASTGATCACACVHPATTACVRACADDIRQDEKRKAELAAAARINGGLAPGGLGMQQI